MSWVPDSKARYAYFFGEASQGPDTFAQTGCPVTPGKDGSGRVLRLGSTPDGFVLAAARTDGSGVTDCWSIASMDRTGPDGVRIPLGVPFHESPP
jgi:hypothetical protein